MSVRNFLGRVFPHGVLRFPKGGFRLSPLRSFPARHAVVFGAGFAGIKTGLADLLVQRSIEERSWSEVRWLRTAAFSLFGFAYLGGVQYFLFVPICSRWLFPHTAKFLSLSYRQRLTDVAGIRAVLGQVILDAVLFTPFLYFPVFYLNKECVMTKAAAGWSGRALRRWRENLPDDMIQYLKVWVPAGLFNFSVCPLWMRVPFIAVISMGWTVVLSMRRGRLETSAPNTCAESSHASQPGVRTVILEAMQQ